MIIIENILLALSSLKSNKMRSLLTMLGIIIGISSVIAIMTVGNSVTASVNSSMQSMGANNIEVGFSQKTLTNETNKDGAVFGTVKKSEGLSEKDYLSDEMIENLQHVYGDSIQAISIIEGLGTGRAEIGKDYSNLNVMGVNEGYFKANKVELTAGSLFKAEELKKAAPIAIVSDRVVEKLYGGDVNKALGSTISVNFLNRYEELTITGVYKYETPKIGNFSPLTSDADLTTDFYIPLKTAKNYVHVSGYQSISVVSAAGVNSTEFAKRVEQFFNGYYRNSDYKVVAFSMESMVSEMLKVMGTVTLAISVIAGIALLVGGIGVMNIMLVSITERTREIGTRKALGAANGSIRLQFIVEAVVICLIGGAIGVGLGILLGSAATSVMGFPASASLQSILISLGFSMSIGIFFGYYPANKAAKMNPIDALRYE